MTGLAACQLVPVAQPVPQSASAPQGPKQSLKSADMARYYQRVESDLLVRGLLRVDGGGPDTPYTSAMLARNFEKVTFYDEHTIGTRVQRGTGQERLLSRWDQPVRINVEYGPSVSDEVRAQDTAMIREYAGRLSRITGHPISAGRLRPNFHILVIGEDDKSAMTARVRALLPSLSASALAQIISPPRATHCLVVVSHAEGPAPRILSAVAVVRAEHPDLLRRSCYHEEIAQGLGIVNDSPFARPSIFNDDDEFALLTSHDEALLAMLYDPRLRIGMSAAEARPTVQTLARERMGDGAET